MYSGQRSPALMVTAALMVAIGLVLLVGGVQLIALGGSWYYGIAGAGFLATGVLLLMRKPAALWLYSVLLLGSLAWAYWEAGLDWWPLAARLGVPFLLGCWLLTPWSRRGLFDRRNSPEPVQHRARSRGGWGAVLVAAGLVLAVSIASWFNDPHRIEGVVPQVADGPPAVTEGVPAGEWHAYGRTGHGQRYSPLEQITPENVDELEVAWEYRTGDVRGQPGDPVETTFEVTPLKIGDRLYLCTPHQSIIALDATTGEEVWRVDPQIQGELALQHLTCRGLSYHPGPTSDALAAGEELSANATTPSDAAPTSAVEDAPAAATTRQTPSGAPVAAVDLPTTDDCTARLFMPTADGRVIALNPEDGRICRGFGNGTGQIDLWANMPHVNPGSYYSTSPAVVTESLLIIGGTVLDNVSTTEPSGVIRAFDVDTGELVWNWDPANPGQTAPLPPGQTYTPTSPNSWSISSVDEELGLVYVPMGNQPPDQWGGNRSSEVERISSSVVALDLETGALRWVFQTVHHDLWDYDVPSQPSLIDLTIDGRQVPALVQPTKQGEVFVLDRRSGEPLLPVTERPVPQGAAEGDWAAPTQPVSALSYDPPPLQGRDMFGASLFDQMACRISLHKLRYEGRYTPPSVEGSLIYPGNFGVFNWGSVAVDPVRQVTFTTPARLAFVSRLIPREDESTLYVNEPADAKDAPPHSALPNLNENFGAPFAVELKPFTSILGLPCQEPPWGFVAVSDLTTGEHIWRHKNGTVRDASPLPLPFEMGVPSLGGPIMTAGGVAFLSGTLDYYVRGYDVDNGEELWRARLPAGGQATPMTYLGSDGRQYLLVIAGGHGSIDTRAGDHVIAYALPSVQR